MKIPKMITGKLLAFIAMVAMMFASNIASAQVASKKEKITTSTTSSSTTDQAKPFERLPDNYSNDEDFKNTLMDHYNKVNEFYTKLKSKQSDLADKHPELQGQISQLEIKCQILLNDLNAYMGKSAGANDDVKKTEREKIKNEYEDLRNLAEQVRAEIKADKGNQQQTHNGGKPKTNTTSTAGGTQPVSGNTNPKNPKSTTIGTSTNTGVVTPKTGGTKTKQSKIKTGTTETSPNN